MRPRAQDEIGFERAGVAGYTSMVVAFLLIYFGVRSYRDNASGGTVSFGRAFKVGSLIGVVASAPSASSWAQMTMPYHRTRLLARAR